MCIEICTNEAKLTVLILNRINSFYNINSHINQHTGKPKIMYNTIKSAKKSADAMSKKTGVHFSYYKCLFCDGYHVGKNRDNKYK